MEGDWKDPDVVAERGLEGTLIARVGRDGSGRCCWMGIGMAVGWKGRWKLLLIVLINVVVDCSNELCC